MKKTLSIILSFCILFPSMNFYLLAFDLLEDTSSEGYITFNTWDARTLAQRSATRTVFLANQH